MALGVGTRLGSYEIVASLGTGGISLLMYAIVGEHDRALEALEQSLRNGYSFEEIRREPELAELRRDPRYSELARRR
jgi:hypothetical protein